MNNRAFTTLATGVDADDLSFVLTDSTVFPSDGALTIVDDLTSPTKVEEVTFTANAANTLTIGTRGAFGSTAQSWSSGAYVRQRYLAEHHEAIRDALIAIETELQSALISVVWGTPAAETANAIEIAASCYGFAGAPFLSGLVDVQIVVSDAANDASPSATATISAAASPVGSIMDGTGTATAIVRTDSNGQFKIKVTETAASDRYLWLSPGGHSRLYPRSSTGVQQLTFS